MSESMERAHETIHEHAEHSDNWARGVAVLVSFLAATLALTEIGAKAAQTEFLTSHVTLSNQWAFFQAKNLRSVMRSSEADLLASLPNADQPAIQTRIKDARDYAARMHDDPAGGDGMKQLAEQANIQQAERDAAGKQYHSYEYVIGGLEIAIVLASVSVVTRMRLMTFGAGFIGVAAAVASAAVALHIL